MCGKSNIFRYFPMDIQEKNTIGFVDVKCLNILDLFRQKACQNLTQRCWNSEEGPCLLKVFLKQLTSWTYMVNSDRSSLFQQSVYLFNLFFVVYSFWSMNLLVNSIQISFIYPLITYCILVKQITTSSLLIQFLAQRILIN